MGKYVEPADKFYCPVEGCKGHEESWHMCPTFFVPPLWMPGKSYKPGDLAVFGQHIWVKCKEPGLWDPA